MTAANESPVKVLVTDRFDDDAFSKLSCSSVISVSRSTSPELAKDDLATVEALLIRSRTVITAELLARATRLKVIITSTSGYDHIDLAAARSRGVHVMFTPDANAASAAELTWGLLIAAARKIPQAHEAVAKGDWKRESLMGSQFAGKTLGIIGLGRIGSRVALAGQAFGMVTIAYDPYKDDSYFNAKGCLRVSLSRLFQMANVITCHLPASDETVHLISRDLLREAKGVVFANTSRGQVVAESSLIEALDQGWLRACALDVFETEPLPLTSPLIGRSNVVLSPHIGATTQEAFKIASMTAAEKIIAFAERGIVTDSLP